jgi:cell division protein FtsN
LELFFRFLFICSLILPRTVPPIPATATVDASPVVLAETETSPSAAEKTVVSADKPSDKTETTPTKTTPRFEFYTVLPDQEVNVNNTSPRPLPLGTNPEADKRKKLPALAVGTAPITTPGTYLLQVGSFRDVREAEGFKKSSGFFGHYFAHIERATLSNSHDVWHRVRLGPFNDLDRLNQTRARLTQHNITAIVVQF